MRRTPAAFASLGVLCALLVLIGVGVAACTTQIAPTPNVEELAKAIANVWATQTAVAASGPMTPTAASTLPAGTAPTAEGTATEPARAVTTPATATPAPATQAPLPSATLAASPTAAATPTTANTPEPTRTLLPTSTPKPFNTFTPGPTSAVACPIAVSPELAGGWNRATLGCPLEDPAVIWAAWEPFQHGMMLWRSDKDETYALVFANSSDNNQGKVVNGGDAWRWDNSFPNGRGLTPPLGGFFEPIRGFGYVWYNYLGGPEGQLGWATQPEQGICVTRQTFEGGVLVKSSTVNSCQDNLLNMASSAAFTPLFLTIGDDGQWQRH